MRRGHTSDLAVIRMAAEGIPLAAIARIMMRSPDDVRAILFEAIALKHLARMPVPEWPEGSDFTHRRPTLPIEDLRPVHALAVKLQLATTMTPAEARFTAALAVWGLAHDSALLRVITVKTGVHPDLVKVQASFVRGRLKARGISFETVWGIGYAMDEANRAKVYDLVKDRQGTSDAA